MVDRSIAQSVIAEIRKNIKEYYLSGHCDEKEYHVVESNAQCSNKDLGKEYIYICIYIYVCICIMYMYILLCLRFGSDEHPDKYYKLT